jgi:hypothetical protein
MVGELAHQDVGQQAGTGQATVDRPDRHRGLHDRVTAASSRLGALVANDAEARRYIFQLLGYVLFERLERTAAIGTLRFIG